MASRCSGHLRYTWMVFVGWASSVKKQRPVYLNPFTYKYPIAAIASITHRITGILLFVGIGYLLWLLKLALTSPEGFERVARILELPLPKLILTVVLIALVYHVFAGLKHMVMDFHHWDSLEGGRYSSVAVMILTALFTPLIVLWLW